MQDLQCVSNDTEIESVCLRLPVADTQLISCTLKIKLRSLNEIVRDTVVCTSPLLTDCMFNTYLNWNLKRINIFKRVKSGNRVQKLKKLWELEEIERKVYRWIRTY